MALALGMGLELGCGGDDDDDGEAGPVDAGEADAGLTGRYAIVLDPTVPYEGTRSANPFPASGRVLDLDGVGFPPLVAWELTSDRGAESGTASVDAAGAWSANLELDEGDNAIRFSVPDTDVAEQILITYNAGYEFGGDLQVSPDVAYIGEPRQTIARIALTDEDTDPLAVALVRVDGADETLLAMLTDDGNLAGGDDIEGDRIFSGLFNVEGTEEASIRYRAVVGRASGGAARSEVRDVLVTAHVDPLELDAILATHGDYQGRIAAAAAAGELDAELDEIAAALEADPAVATVGRSDTGRGLWLVYENGIAAVLESPEPGIKGGGPRGLEPLLPLTGRDDRVYAPRSCPGPATRRVGRTAGDDEVDSSKALVIAAQYWDWGDNDDIPKMEQILRDDSCYEVRSIRYTSEGSGSVEDFKGLGNYGVVLISSHGDSFYNGILSLWADRFKWNGPFGQVVLHTNMRSGPENLATYEDDLKRGRVVLWYGDYGVTPSFIRTYTGQMPDSLVYMSICRGTWNATLAQAFLERGAASFLGYSDYVDVPFTEAIGPPLLTTLLTPDKTMADAFVAGQVETDSDPAEFILYGSGELSIALEDLEDGSLESGQIGQAWTVDGDARIVPALGDFLPTDRSLTAIISTGLGFTTETGTMAQQLCLPMAERVVSFDWNFFSEEFPEYVGSQFQDAFIVTLTDVDDEANSVELLNVFIDSLAAEVSPVSNSFDQGDVSATGWRTVEAAIPPALHGKTVQIRFFATDVGDSIYDTAVLIDNIQLREP